MSTKEKVERGKDGLLKLAFVFGFFGCLRQQDYVELKHEKIELLLSMFCIVVCVFCDFFVCFVCTHTKQIQIRRSQTR